MKEGRPINYLSVENISLDHLACGNARFFHNQHLSIILNGKPLNTTFFQKEIIYHVAEARLILILKGCVEGNLNLEDQYIEQGHVLLLPACVGSGVWWVPLRVWGWHAVGVLGQCALVA